MESIIYIILGVVAAVFGMKFFKRSDKDVKRALEYHKIDTELKTRQELKEEKMARLKKRLKEQKEAQKLKKTEDVEKWWKK